MILAWQFSFPENSSQGQPKMRFLGLQNSKCSGGACPRPPSRIHGETAHAHYTHSSSCTKVTLLPTSLVAHKYCITVQYSSIQYSCSTICGTLAQQYSKQTRNTVHDKPAAITGSDITSRVIGHKNSSGMLPSISFFLTSLTFRRILLRCPTGPRNIATHYTCIMYKQLQHNIFRNIVT